MGHSIAGKVWRVTLKAVDFVTAPVRGVINLLRSPVFQAAGVIGVGLGTADMVRTYAGFQQSMADIRAISNMTRSEMDLLGDSFRGMAGNFGAAEIAGAAKNFVTIGRSADEILAKMPYAMTLSAASGMELYNTTYFLNNIINKLGGNLDLVAQATDSMAMAAALAHQPLENIMSSWNYMGTAVRNASMNMNEANAVLITLSDAGYRGSQSGTMFSAMMQNLMAPASTAAAQAMENLGFSMFDAYGGVRPFGYAMHDLAARLNRLQTPYERVNKLTDIFGIQGVRAADVILNNVDNLTQYTEALEGAAGAAQRMADVRTDTLQGSFTRLRSGVENLHKTIMERFEPQLTGFVNWLVDRLPAAERAVGNFLDNAMTKARRFGNTIRGVMNGEAWQDASFFGRIGILWDEVIGQPLVAWWNDRGKGKVANVAQSIGTGMGSAIRWGIQSLFGMGGEGIEGIAADGMGIGRAFVQGFGGAFDGMDWSVVSDGLISALKTVWGWIWSNPLTGAIAGAWLAGKSLGAISSVGRGVAGIKGVAAPATVNMLTQGGGLFGGVAHGLALHKAANAAGAGPSVQMLHSAAQKGQYGLGAKIGSAGFGGMMMGAAGIAGGIYGGITAFRGVGNLVSAAQAQDEAETAALRSAGGRQLGGALTGAAAGAAIGSFIPGVGTLIGAGVGALIGGYMGNRSAIRIMDSHERSVYEAQAEARALFIKQEQAMYGTVAMRQAVADLHNGIINEHQFAVMKHETLMNGIHERFGAVRLTMREVQSLAQGIAYGGMTENMGAFADASARSQNAFGHINGLAGDIARFNWKASIELDFDKGQFKSVMDAYVNSAQSFVTNRHYEMAMAKQLLGVDDTAGLNNVFSQIQGELTVLSKSLTAKFKLEPEAFDPQAVFAIKSEIAKIMNEVAGAGFEAELKSLYIRMGSDNLSYGSILAFTEEANKAAEGMRSELTRAFETAYQGYYLQLGRGEIDEAQFYYKVSKIEAVLREGLEGVDNRISDFLTESIEQAFDMDAGKLTSAIQESIQNNINPMHWTAENVYRFLGIASLRDGAANELSLLMGQLTPYVQNWNHGTNPAFWETKSPHVWDGLPLNSVWDPFGTGAVRPEGTVSAGVWVPPSKDVTGRPIGQDMQSVMAGLVNNVPAWANGGIISTPHYGLVAEAGPEAIIPLSGNRNRALDLYEQTGQMLGVNSGGGVTVEVGGITIHVGGGNSAADTVDEIAEQLAFKLESVFANLPVALKPSPA
jgi:TP901 family phage tail tape measure protein